MSMPGSLAAKVRQARKWGAVLACGLAVMVLVGCGGDGGTTGPTPPSSNDGAATLGKAGGQVNEASGVVVTVPAGALSADTTLRIAQDATGAPAFPADLAAAGSIYAITPHGSSFAQPVEVRLPKPATALQANQKWGIAKAELGGSWQVLPGVVDDGSTLSVPVSGFSFFAVVPVTFAQPVALVDPIAFRGQPTATCPGSPTGCGELIAATPVTASVATNAGQWPALCQPGTGRLELRYQYLRGGYDVEAYTDYWVAATLPDAGGTLTFTPVDDVRSQKGYYFALSCVRINADGLTFRMTVAETPSLGISYDPQVLSPDIRVTLAPSTLQVVEGTPARLTVVMKGGAGSWNMNDDYSSPTRSNEAVVEWERSEDQGASWFTVGTSYQTEADPLPMGAALHWRHWSVAHGWTASAADAGALLRAKACYTPPSAPDNPCVVSPATRLTLVQQSALPAITTQPVSIRVLGGQTASFNAKATGTPAPALQWQTRDANATGAWADVGTPGESYTTPVLTLADNGRQYRVVARSALGSTESAIATVSVSDLAVAPSITSQPASLNVASGGDAVFAVAADGTAPLSYQWRFNGAAIAGANAALLRLTGLAAGQAGLYSVEVRNGAGLATSNAAALTVTAGTPPVTAPSIVTAPASLNVAAGSDATLAVGVSGSGPLSFQWWKDGTAIPGATAAAYTRSGVGSADAGRYRVVVSNAAGSVTSPEATLTLTASNTAVAPSIATGPGSVVAGLGMSATLAVAVQGTGPFSYQWLHDGQPVAGAHQAVLGFASVGALDAGRYEVQVANAAGSVTSAPATLTLLGAPLITSSPAAATAVEGASASFAVTATGQALRYQWLRNGVAIDGAISASYTTPALTLADSGAVLRVLVYNGAGLAFSNDAVLSVQPAPVSLTLASVNAAGAPTAGNVDLPSVSSDGRRVAFRSDGTDLVAGTGGGELHAYLRDVGSGSTLLVNRSVSGGTSARGVTWLKVAGNGRHVVFTSLANDLVAGDTNLAEDVFVRDLQAGTTVRVNVLPDGSQDAVSGNATGYKPDISADGRYVVMVSGVDLAATGAALPELGVFLRDMTSHVTRAVPLVGTPLGANASISADGSIVAVLTQQGSDIALELFATATGATTTAFATPVADSLSSGSAGKLALSGDGRYVALVAFSANWFGGAAATRGQIAVFDRLATGTLAQKLTLASATAIGVAADGSNDLPSISADGRYVAFQTAAPNLSGNAANAGRRVLVVKDMVSGSVAVGSRASGGSAVATASDRQALSGNGFGLVFVAPAQDMLGGGVSNTWQAFVAPRP